MLVTEAAKALEQKRELPASQESRKPWQKGQWVTFLMESRDRDNELKLRTLRILDSRDSETQIEVETISALKEGKPEIEGYWIENLPLTPRWEATYRQMFTALNAVKFKKVVVSRPEKELEEWPENLLYFSRSWLEKIFVIGHSLEDRGARPESCDNGIMKSERCYVQRFRFQYLDINIAGRAFLHSEVPILGFLQAVDDNYVYHVIAFGDQGAEPKLSF